MQLCLHQIGRDGQVFRLLKNSDYSNPVNNGISVTTRLNYFLKFLVTILC